ncbi:protein-disulfide reductase DsbD family protein [Litoreibacter roseus]|uniref:Thiol:disulfide interchange protein DsbD n=1 Tax=Litoreibacter roseus TaxID=2601869 RepID=A0A6N6JCC9_9RHOB|nr:protein-disulfide reductase DsbD domain-containing protein [Litoreibacter roseus]GFE63981.1 thiol:disulfide interchange protein DsbD [Litoreibacter roseus]
MIQFFKHALMPLVLALCLTGAAQADASLPFESERLTARLVTAEDGIAPDTQVLSAGLEITLADGWKTYWISPGEVGYAHEIDWTGSHNLADVETMWPTPTRFEAFGIENYGYANAVTFPMKLMLEEPGAPTDLTANVNMLVCADLCVPETFTLTLSLFEGGGVDRATADIIAHAVQTVPGDGTDIGLTLESVYIDQNNETLTLVAKSKNALKIKGAFPDMGDAAFGPPRFETGSTDHRVTLPVLNMPEDLPPLNVVLASTAGAAAFSPDLSAAPPETSAAAPTLLWVVGIAFLGGLILNAMPCVLPVLTIKLTSALKAHDQPQARIRQGFLMSALGVLAFMWSLALILLAIRFSGGQIGWGIQFQSPLFLSAMAGIVLLFAANMLGAFEITLPQKWATGLSGIGKGPSLWGDFGTGALAAVLATPCSAPFLGTAVAFALAGSADVTLVVFTALGLGLALPYLLVAARPSLVQALPRPGQWMVTIKWVMGGLLALTGLWLLFVLNSVSGIALPVIVAIMIGIAVLAQVIARKLAARFAAAALAMAAILLAPLMVSSSAQVPETSDNWAAFERAAIDPAIADGQIVFVDVTADWCLSCKTNKRFVLDRDDVSAALYRDGVLALRADWTRPDPKILAYLQENDRFGIPFNAVYGPGAPEGVMLPEILTPSLVLDALAKAAG